MFVRKAFTRFHLFRVRKLRFSHSTAASLQTSALGMSLGNWDAVLGQAGFERYRSQQVYNFIHKTSMRDDYVTRTLIFPAEGEHWEDATFLPKALRSWLTEKCLLDWGKVTLRQASCDGTRKFLIQVSPGKIVETVFIPEADRATLCVSSQVGCSLRCTFCHTGTQKFSSNLTSSEILCQYYALPPGIRAMVTNFVFMGQGEPLYNWSNISEAVEIMVGGMGFGHRRVTISTSGITPLIPKIASELGVNLAVSLHAPNDELRSQIMPINKTYPLSALIEACEKFIQGASCATRRVSFEYVMLRGVNDQASHARELATLVKHLPAHVNLIPFNPWPGSSYACSPPDVTDRFLQSLEERGLPTTIRRPRGRDIMAACGQLRSSLAEGKQPIKQVS